MAWRREGNMPISELMMAQFTDAHTRHSHVRTYGEQQLSRPAHTRVDVIEIYYEWK